MSGKSTTRIYVDMDGVLRLRVNNECLSAVISRLEKQIEKLSGERNMFGEESESFGYGQLLAYERILNDLLNCCSIEIPTPQTKVIKHKN